MGNIIPNIFGRHNAVIPAADSDSLNPAQNTSQVSQVSNIAPSSSYSAQISDGRKKKRSKKRSLKKKRT